MLQSTRDIVIERIRQLPVEEQEYIRSARRKAHAESIKFHTRRISAPLTPTTPKSKDHVLKMGEHPEPDFQEVLISLLFCDTISG